MLLTDDPVLMRLVVSAVIFIMASIVALVCFCKASKAQTQDSGIGMGILGLLSLASGVLTVFILAKLANPF